MRNIKRQCFVTIFTAWLFQVRKAQIIEHKQLRSRRQVLKVIFSDWRFKGLKCQVKRDDFQSSCRMAMNVWQQRVVQKLKILRIIRAYQNKCRRAGFQRHVPLAENGRQKMVPVRSAFSPKSRESTRAAQFQKSDRYEKLHSKLRQLLIVLRNARLSRYALQLLEWLHPPQEDCDKEGPEQIKEQIDATGSHVGAERKGGDQGAGLVLTQKSICEGRMLDLQQVRRSASSDGGEGEQFRAVQGTLLLPGSNTAMFFCSQGMSFGELCAILRAGYITELVLNSDYLPSHQLLGQIPSIFSFFLSCGSHVLRDSDVVADFQNAGNIFLHLHICFPAGVLGADPSSPNVDSTLSRMSNQAGISQEKEPGDCGQTLECQRLIGLWVQNFAVPASGPWPLYFLDTDLSTVHTIQGLSQLIQSALNLDVNQCSVKYLGFSKDDISKRTIHIVECNKIVMTEFKICDDEPWAYGKASSRGKAYECPISLAKVDEITSKFESFSARMKHVFSETRFDESRAIIRYDGPHRRRAAELLATSQPKQELHDFLGYAILRSSARERKRTDAAAVIQKGLGIHPQAVLSNQLSESSATGAPDLYCRDAPEFPERVFPGDLEISGYNMHLMVRRGKSNLSFAQDSLIDFLQLREGVKCELRHTVSGARILDFPSEDKKPYKYLKLRCKGRDRQRIKCTYYCKYRYEKLPCSVNARDLKTAIFKRVKFSSNHSCDQLHCGFSFRGTQGSSTWNSAHLLKARWLAYAEVDLRTIAQAFGFHKGSGASSHSIDRTATRLYHAIRYQDITMKRNAYSELLTYFKQTLESGETAFVSLQGLNGVDTAKPRLVVQLANQLALLKLGWAPAASIDFAYKFILGWNVAFGMLTVLTPAGSLATVALFFIETENKDGIDFVLEKIKLSLQHFGIKFQPMVNSFARFGLVYLVLTGPVSFTTDCIP